MGADWSREGLFCYTRSMQTSQRPFTPADIPWVYEVSRDPVLQRFMQVPSPYRLEDATSHDEQDYIAGWDDGRQVEFVAEDAATATRLGRVGLRLGDGGVVCGVVSLVQ